MSDETMRRYIVNKRVGIIIPLTQSSSISLHKMYNAVECNTHIRHKLYLYYIERIIIRRYNMLLENRFGEINDSTDFRQITSRKIISSLTYSRFNAVPRNVQTSRVIACCYIPFKNFQLDTITNLNIFKTFYRFPIISQ